MLLHPVRAAWNGYLGVRPPSPPALPSGVTLQAIDGESMTSSLVMSNNYFSRNNFTRATTPFGTAKSWDDPTWFPILTFYTEADTTSNGFPKMLDLGYNTGVATFSGANYALFGTNSFWYWNVEANDAPTPSANYIVGTYADEPQTEKKNNVGSPLYPYGVTSTIPGTNIQGGPIWMTQTNFSLGVGQFGSDVANSPNYPTAIYPNRIWTTHTPNSENRSCDVNGYDLYFYAGSTSGLRQQDGWRAINQSLAGGSLTTDQMARGSNYGYMIDEMRRDWSPTNSGTGGNGPFETPLNCFVENGAANDTGNGSRAITSDEMICAVWSSLIHGARMVCYFYYTDIVGLSAGSAIYDATKSTNAQIQALASVLNSPFALNYVTVNQNGYNFPVYNQTALKAFTNTGFQVMAKWYSGSTSGVQVQNRFYIFAGTTYGESGYTTQTANFTIKNQGYTTATVIYSSDNASPSPIPITGGTTFSDTFPHPWSIRIYRIDP